MMKVALRVSKINYAVFPRVVLYAHANLCVCVCA